VIIDDALGIGDELEAEMAHVVGSYQCEWKTTIEDSEKLKFFKTYLNSDLADSHIQFVQERGQRRPATKQEKQLDVVTL